MFFSGKKIATKHQKNCYWFLRNVIYFVSAALPLATALRQGFPTLIPGHHG